MNKPNPELALQFILTVLKWAKTQNEPPPNPAGVLFP